MKHHETETHTCIQQRFFMFFSAHCLFMMHRFLPVRHRVGPHMFFFLMLCYWNPAICGCKNDPRGSHATIRSYDVGTRTWPPAVSWPDPFLETDLFLAQLMGYPHFWGTSMWSVSWDSTNIVLMNVTEYIYYSMMMWYDILELLNPLASAVEPPWPCPDFALKAFTGQLVASRIECPKFGPYRWLLWPQSVLLKILP